MQLKNKNINNENRTGSRLLPPGPKRIPPVKLDVHKMQEENDEAIWC